jgi:hypothetical protein
MTPNFTTMMTSVLQSYVLAHRKDEAAFQTLIDRLKVNGSGIQYPCPNTPEARCFADTARVALTQKAIREKLGK